MDTATAPRTGKSTFIGFRCPADVAQQLKKSADLQQRSLSNFILYHLTAAAAPAKPRRNHASR